MTIRLGDIAPDFTQDSTAGEIRFHDWIGDGWDEQKPYLRVVPQPNV